MMDEKKLDQWRNKKWNLKKLKNLSKNDKELFAKHKMLINLVSVMYYRSDAAKEIKFDLEQTYTSWKQLCEDDPSLDLFRDNGLRFDKGVFKGLVVDVRNLIKK